MHYNPCGKAVDFARRGYTTTARPFRNSNETVKLVWFPAREEDGTLPFPSRICSLDWHSRPHEARGVGEVYGAPRKFNRRSAVPGPKRDHVCGTADDFANGEVLDITKPPTIYLPSGLPTCCEARRREAEGGAGVGGVGEVIGGAIKNALGGVGIMGAAAVLRGRLAVAGGGLGVGGAAVVMLGQYLTASGGVGSGGLNQVIRGRRFTSSGGVGAGGEVEPLRGVLVEASGGVGAGGEADVETPAPPPTGPGGTCPVALAATLGTVYSFTAPASPGEHWYHYAAVSGFKMLFTTGVIGSGDKQLFVYNMGSSCASLGTPTLHSTNPEGVPVFAGNVWIKVVTTTGGGSAYTLQLS